MVALHVLFASLAILAAARESDRPHLPSSQAGHNSTGPLEAFSALWHYNQVALDPFSPLCTARRACSPNWFQRDDGVFVVTAAYWTLLCFAVCVLLGGYARIGFRRSTGVSKL